jgi:hypothetical protein
MVLELTCRRATKRCGGSTPVPAASPADVGGAEALALKPGVHDPTDAPFPPSTQTQAKSLNQHCTMRWACRSCGGNRRPGSVKCGLTCPAPELHSRQRLARRVLSVLCVSLRMVPRLRGGRRSHCLQHAAMLRLLGVWPRLRALYVRVRVAGGRTAAGSLAARCAAGPKGPPEQAGAPGRPPPGPGPGLSPRRQHHPCVAHTRLLGALGATTE